MSTTLYIKDMVCVRCKIAVEAVLKASGIGYSSVELGKANLLAPLTAAQREALVEGLAYYQLELLEGRSKVLVERIKAEIRELLQSPHQLHIKLSAHLSQKLDYNYTYLANTFSEEEGITLEKYFIQQRVERVKEIMVYEGLSLAQITDELHYSSVSHLCLQFKKVTGLTPAEFKEKCASGDFVWRPV